MKIPINIFHGTFEEAHSFPNDASQPSYAANAPADGYIVTGAVMGYDAPPMGEQALFRPAAPVTDSGLTTTMWSNPNNEPTIIRPNRPQGHSHNAQQQRQPSRGAPPCLHSATSNTHLSSSLPPPPPREATVSGRNGETGTDAMAENNVLNTCEEESNFTNPLVMSRIPLSSVNRRPVGSSGEDSSHYVYRNENNPSAAAGNAPVTEEDPNFQCITPPAERLSAHRRMYEHVPPSWVKSERRPVEPIEDLSTSTPTQQNQTLPSTPADGAEVTTTTFI